MANNNNVLLGYNSQKALLNITSSSRDDSEVDFTDVFGGPPRRCSTVHDSRYSFGETNDSHSFRGEDGSGEKPVFGDDGVNRRRNRSDDFFDDIFRGDESSNSTPRREAYGSNVFSPVRSRYEPSASSSLPTSFSLPAKLAKGTDFPAMASLSRSPHKSKDSSASMSRFSSEATHVLDNLKNDTPESYSQNTFFQEPRHSISGSSKATEPEKLETGDQLKKDSNTSEGSTNSSHFHFSIYKWASKGVPVSMPLRGGNSSKSKEKAKNESSSSYIEKVESDVATLYDLEHNSVNSSMSTSTKSFKLEFEKQEIGLFLDKSDPDKTESRQDADVAKVSVDELQTHESFLGNISVVKETKPQSLFEVGLWEKTEKEVSVPKQEAKNPELQSLRTLLSDHNDGQGNDEIVTHARGKETTGKSVKRTSRNIDDAKTTKKQNGKISMPNPVEMKNGGLQDSPIPSGPKTRGSGVRGKVKEFVNIFNQEASPKPAEKLVARSQSSRWKDIGTSKSENTKTGFNRTGSEQNLHRPDPPKKAFPVDSVMVDKNEEREEKQPHSINTGSHRISETKVGPKKSSTPSPESIINDFEATFEYYDEPFEGNFMVTELSEDHNELPQTDKLQEQAQVKESSQDQNKQPQTPKPQEEIQATDAKIRQWSNGRAGNIRSLLSTLQFVLWPESGWKPVPLVDIIEGNAVRRTYQKALLCLHPDKLQQKGVDSHKKYIAEKVFDIVQEAWDQFNSPGTF